MSQRLGAVAGSAAALAATYLAYRRLRRRPPVILFDVDGTLAVPAQKAEDAIVEMLARLRSRGNLVGIVGAGDFKKQERQLGGPDLRQRLDFCFSENGVHAFRGETLLHCKSIVEQVGEARWREFEEGLNALLSRVREEAEGLLRQAAGPTASLAARGTFLERRQCTCNVCVIGRTPDLSKAERAAFEAADAKVGLRKRVLDELMASYGPATPYALSFAIGGQIGIDCSPVGWDKTFCLRFLPAREFPIVHFFGDKTHEGGGDYELYEHPRTIGHAVTSAEHTLELVEKLFLS
mmetsp:Transcript_10473/g.32361  ORF Transcript_10473/g.32361 Transcript_10473/m.32361 type:complete len:293 (+) Transcript_10473:90-968(+)